MSAPRHTEGAPVAWEVRNAEISYRAVFGTEREARLVADEHDESGYSQAVVRALFYAPAITPEPAAEVKADAGAITGGSGGAVYALVYRDGMRFGSETYTDLGKAQRAWAYTNCSYSDLNAPLLINLTTQMVMLPDGSERPLLPTPPAPNQGDES